MKRTHEYILMYAKKEELFPHPPVVDPSVPNESKLFKEEIRNTIVKNGPKNPISDIELPVGFPADFNAKIIRARKNIWPHYKIDAHIKNGKLINSITVRSGWSSKDLIHEFIKNDCQPVIDAKGQSSRFVISDTGAIEVIKERSKNQSHVISSLSGFGGPQKASAEIESLGVIFDDYPKPVSLIKYFVQMVEGEDDVILDFFAGSATTAHAVLDLNKQDNGNRKFILVQLPEPCAPDSEAFKAGYKTIADIGKEPIRRVIKKLTENDPPKMVRKHADKNQIDLFESHLKEPIPSIANSSLDLGFKVLKLDKSNFKPWQKLDPSTPVEKIEAQLELFVDHIVPEATQEDLLYEILLKVGFTPTEKIEIKNISGKKVFSVAGGALLLCLEDSVTKELVDAVAEAEPTQFICLDSAFHGNDQLKANAVQTFAARNMQREKHNRIIFRTV